MDKSLNLQTDNAGEEASSVAVPTITALADTLANTGLNECETPNLRPDVTAGNNRSRVSQATSPRGNSRQAPFSKPVMKKELAYQQLQLVKRPDRIICESPLGTKLTVEANYFTIKCHKFPIVFQYDFQFYKLARNQQLLMRKREETLLVFWKLVMQHRDRFPESHFMVFNGVNILYTTERLRGDAGTWKLPVYVDNKRFGVTIKFAKSIRLEADPQTVAQMSDIVCILDQVIGARTRDQTNPISQRFVQIGHSTFFDSDINHTYDERLKIAIGQGLEVWTGLHGAVKPRCQLGMLLNVDLGHSLFHRKDYNLVKYLLELINCCTFGETSIKELEGCRDSTGLNRKGRKLLENALKGMTLTYCHPAGYEKGFMFSGIANKSASAHIIESTHLGQISIKEYYEKTYPYYSLQFPHLPCLQLSKMKRTFVPMEMVFTTKESIKLKGKIPDVALRKMVQKTSFNPLDRKGIIGQLAISDGSHPNQPVFLAEEDDYMKSFGISVDRKFVKCRATLLPEPVLEYGKNRKGENVIVEMDHQGVWSLELPEENTLKKAHFDKETKVVPMVVFMDKVRANIDPLRTIMEVLLHFGIRLPLEGSCWNIYKIPQQANWNDVTRDFGLFKKAVAEEHPGALPLIIVVFPFKCTTHRQMNETYSSEYSMLKYICDVQLGIHQQGILEKTWGQCQGNALTCTTAHNLGIKILAKIGISHYKLQRGGFHKNWSRFTNPEEPTLVMGIDVTHPGIQDRGRGGHAALSVACVVGSIDLDASKFESSMRVQFTGEERTFSLEREMKERICGFVVKTGKKPSHVVIYRDGVSETQFKEVLYEDKEAFKNACLELDPSFKPTLTYIVLTKRHHTRFFPMKPEDTHEKAFNLKPGTLVETEVTSTEYFDWFLLSQHGPLGTSRPGHYYVLWDDWKPSYAFWQTITHCLAYSYARCNKSISQPSPIMYAHLAAKRAKDYVMAHFERHAVELKKMTAYEQVMHIKQHGTKKNGLDGMVFL